MTTRTRDREAEEILEAVEAKYGFRPNLIEELVTAPAAAQVYLRGQDAMADSSLSPAEQQAVQLAVATANGCDYCTAAHGALGADSGIAREDLEAIRRGETPGDPDLAAVVEAARRVVEERGWLDEDDLAELEAVGVDRRKLYEVVAFVALKTLSNYVNHIAGTEVDEAFR